MYSHEQEIGRPIRAADIAVQRVLECCHCDRSDGDAPLLGRRIGPRAGKWRFQRAATWYSNLAEGVSCLSEDTRARCLIDERF
jgi:hypothetical protein